MAKSHEILLTSENFRKAVCCPAWQLESEFFQYLQDLSLDAYWYSDSIILRKSTRDDSIGQEMAFFANTNDAFFAVYSCLRMFVGMQSSQHETVESSKTNQSVIMREDMKMLEDDSEFEIYLERFRAQVDRFAEYGFLLKLDTKARVAYRVSLHSKTKHCTSYQITEEGYNRAINSFLVFRHKVEMGERERLAPLTADEMEIDIEGSTGDVKAEIEFQTHLRKFRERIPILAEYGVQLTIDESARTVLYESTWDEYPCTKNYKLTAKDFRKAMLVFGALKQRVKYSRGVKSESN